MASVSIIICTRNRSDDLRRTLASLARVRVPRALDTELLLVDNGSTDETPTLIRTFSRRDLSVRAVHVPKPGLSRARNAGLAASRGDVMLFTDDDVRLPCAWIARMSAPLLSGKADAVAGGVVLAPHLCRPWMTPQNTAVLATTAAIDPARPQRMVGANMAFSRHVLQKVPVFDVELGAGTQIGAGEETLFSLQVRQAGFRMVSAFDAPVEHHCDPGRLTPAARRAGWEKVGRAQAYIAHHWRHETSSFPRIGAALAFAQTRLVYDRLTRPAPPLSDGGGGLSETVSDLVHRLAYQRQLLKERRRPRNYTRRGLVKQQGERPQYASTSFVNDLKGIY